MRNIFRRFRQFGGWNLIVTYLRMGLFGKCCTLAAKTMTGRMKPIEAYHALLLSVEEKLRKRFEPVMIQKEKEYKNLELKRNPSRYVWTCWLQGLDNAPDLVKVCHASLCEYIKDRSVVVLTNKNLQQYVTLPEYILRKHEQGIIPDAAFSDMLRLELLCKHGGTWIDATVLCTGDEGIKELMDADLFVFQQIQKETTQFLGLSSWMMSATANNWFLMVVRDMLFAYWKKENCVTDYFLIHLFFCMLAEHHPEIVAKMPRKGNRIPHYLSRRLAEPYDAGWMEELKRHSCFHKLSYRLNKESVEKEGTFYDVLINKNGMQ